MRRTDGEASASLLRQILMTKLSLAHPYGSHIPVLISAILLSEGDILELGSGLFSTPALHYFSLAFQRNLVTYENSEQFYEELLLARYRNSFHTVMKIHDWADIRIDRPWGVAFVDCRPESDRQNLVQQIAKLAHFVVVHDWVQQFPYTTFSKLFRYNHVYRYAEPFTAVYSNKTRTDDLLAYLHSIEK